jgi:hypothetical protein
VIHVTREPMTGYSDWPGRDDAWQTQAQAMKNRHKFRG